MSESHTLARDREIRAGAWRGEGGFHGEESGFQEGEAGQARRTSLEVEGSISE